MPVLATPSPIADVLCCDVPANIPLPAAVSCAGLYVLAPKTSADQGRPLLTRMQSVSLRAGQAGTLAWQFKNPDGQPLDLTDCLCADSTSSISVAGSAISHDSAGDPDCPHKVIFRLQEYLSLGHAGGLLTCDATVIDAATGQVQVSLTPAQTDRPGIYFGEMVLQATADDGQTYDLFTNAFYVQIARGPGGIHSRGGPPSIAEVRLSLRDSSPAESYLLNRLRFDDAEIALATARPVEYWNEIPPDLGRYLTTSTFPYRHFWLEAIAGYLFLMAAEQFRANHLSYSAGGVQLDDQAKESNYEQAAQTRLGEWRAFVKRKKAELNMQDCFSTFGSPYG